MHLDELITVIGPLNLTEHFLEISRTTHEFYVIQNRRSADSQALNCEMFGQIVVVNVNAKRPTLGHK